MNRRWAEGIEPQKLLEIVSGLFVAEQIGGFGTNYRKVRRDVEIAWIKRHEFDVIISLLPTPQNLQNYKSNELECVHFPILDNIEGNQLVELSELVQSKLDEGKKILMHRYRRTDFMAGLIASFILSRNLVSDEADAILRVENLQGKKLGEDGRRLVKLTIEELENASEDVEQQEKKLQKT